MSTADVDFPPLLNGLDYLESVVDTLQGTPSSRELKYAILHLVAGTEVLLKSRLSQEHWTLVFDNPGKATQEAWLSGEFRSCTILEAHGRLEEIASVEFPNNAEQWIRALLEKRNRLQHFGLSDSSHAVQAIAIRALNLLLTFITKELSEGLSDEEEELMARIRSQLAGIDKLVESRLAELGPTLDARSVIVTCPDCAQLSLEPGDNCQCHFCGMAAPAEDVARKYLYTVFGEDEYSAAKGRTGWSLNDCPECGRDTLVTNVEVRGHSPDQEGFFACCFADAIIWSPRELSRCMHCGRPIPLEEEGPDLCSDCLAAAIERY